MIGGEQPQERVPAFLLVISSVSQLLHRASEKSWAIRTIRKEKTQEHVGGRLPDRFTIGRLLQRLCMLVARGPGIVPFPGFVWRSGWRQFQIHIGQSVIAQEGPKTIFKVILGLSRHLVADIVGHFNSPPSLALR